MQKSLLKITNLSFDYHDNFSLQDISFSLFPGGLVHLKGINGAGKTTLMRLITGIFTPDAGSIEINGRSLFEDPVTYKQQLCFVSHKTGLNPHLTVLETLAFDLQNQHAHQDLMPILAQSGMENLAHVRCANLSVGQKRRVSLLRLSLSGAKLWLLDEPFIALDEDSVKLLTSQINRHRLVGGAVLITSHQLLPGQYDYQEYQL